MRRSVTTTLHVVSGELRRLVNGREELLAEAAVFGTVEMLLFKLVLERGPVGHLIMKLDYHLYPDLFLTDIEKKEKWERQNEEDAKKKKGEGDGKQARDDILDSEDEDEDEDEDEEDKEGEGKGKGENLHENPLVADLENTTSEIRRSGPASLPGSITVVPGNIAYRQGEEEKGEEEKGEEARETFF